MDHLLMIGTAVFLLLTIIIGIVLYSRKDNYDDMSTMPGYYEDEKNTDYEKLGPLPSIELPANVVTKNMLHLPPQRNIRDKKHSPSNQIINSMTGASPQMYTSPKVQRTDYESEVENYASCPKYVY